MSKSLDVKLSKQYRRKGTNVRGSQGVELREILICDVRLVRGEPSSIFANLVVRRGEAFVAKSALETLFNDSEAIIFDLKIACSAQDLLEQHRHLVVKARDRTGEATLCGAKAVVEASDLSVVSVL